MWVESEANLIFIVANYVDTKFIRSEIIKIKETVDTILKML